MGQQSMKFFSVQHKYPWDQPPTGMIASRCNVCGQEHWTDAVSYYNDLLGRALVNRKDDLLWSEVAKFHHEKCPVVNERDVPRISKLQEKQEIFKELTKYE